MAHSSLPLFVHISSIFLERSGIEAICVGRQPELFPSLPHREADDRLLSLFSYHYFSSRLLLSSACFTLLRPPEVH